MDLTSPSQIKEILSKYGAKPNKTMGQNFLIHRNILNKIISAADLKKTDTVLEVGPGLGTLTQELSKHAGQVIAIEKDPAMLQILAETLSEFQNIEVIQADILELEAKSYKLEARYKVVANIPYYLTSHLIRLFLETENPPDEIVLLVQKEVAQRICQKPPKMSLLSVSVQFYAEPKIISYISKNCFMPAPKVDSAILKLEIRNPKSETNSKFKIQNSNLLTPNLLTPGFRREMFFRVVKAGFSAPRKQLAGNLSRQLKVSKKAAEQWLLQNNLKPSQRAETLSVDDWQNLANSTPEAL